MQEMQQEFTGERESSLYKRDWTKTRLKTIHHNWTIHTAMMIKCTFS